MTKPGTSPLETHRELLLLEAALASDSIGHGLTALRAYDFADKGRFFSALFSLSVGIERLLKIIVLMVAAQESGRFPNDQRLKAAGHDIEALLRFATKRNDSLGLAVDRAKVDDPLCATIIGRLTAFAKYARYFNLDAMVGRNRPDDEEPLAAWDRLVSTELVRRHYRHTQQRKRAIAFSSHLARQGALIASHVLEDRTRVTDLGHLAAAAAEIETKRKFAVYYVVCIVEFCVRILEALDRRNSPPTCLPEFFRVFNTLDRQAVLRRKNWAPLR